MGSPAEGVCRLPGPPRRPVQHEVSSKKDPFPLAGVCCHLPFPPPRGERQDFSGCDVATPQFEKLWINLLTAKISMVLPCTQSNMYLKCIMKKKKKYFAIFLTDSHSLFEHLMMEPGSQLIHKGIMQMWPATYR